MKLLAVTKDSRYLYIETDQGTRKQSLNWRGVDALEKKCRALIGCEIEHSTAGSWDSNIWFQDVYEKRSIVDHLYGVVSSTDEKPYRTHLKFETKSTRRIYGPPGTGKTTELIRITNEAACKGVDLKNIGYFAFTNIAADEALTKVMETTGKSKDDFIGFSTLHSLATRIGGNLGRKLCSKDDLYKFDTQIGAKEEWMKPGDLASIVVRPIHPILDAISFQLATLKSNIELDSFAISKAVPKLAIFFQVTETAIEADFSSYSKKYHELYTEFKNDNNLADFNDVIVNAVSKDFPEDKIPSFELLIIDEAQDLSALQWKLVEKLQQKAKETIIAGDDDQAIMEGFGASPQNFNNFPTTEADTILSVSHRVPSAVKQFVDKNLMPRIAKQNKTRKFKEWTENPHANGSGTVTTHLINTRIENGEQIQLRERMKTNNLIRLVAQSPQDDWLIMAPTKATCDVISNGLEKLSIGHFLHRQDILDTANSNIKIQTVHTSKGMGAERVAFVQLSRGDSWMIQQDLRLFYVAVTRAKKDLYLITE
jgi:superfamily I DNA/RNA helicase